MEYLPYIAGLSILAVSALFIEVYHTCDDCQGFDWSVRYRKGQNVRRVFQSRDQALLCDKCMELRSRRLK